jgi:Tol biopolymer transport system component
MKCLLVVRISFLVFLFLPVGATAQVIERVSVNSDGVQANGVSRLGGGRWQVSDDGRFVVFESEASNLVDNDMNGFKDVFVRDLELRTTTRVSVNTAGSDANAPCGRPAISGDGRYVAFESAATNLVVGGTNGTGDVFVRDLLTGQTTRITLSLDGGEPDGPSGRASVSGDGRYVAFLSAASNLVEEDGNGVADIFVRDLEAGLTERVSVNTDGGDSNVATWVSSISANGRHVTFSSSADNLVDDDINGFRDVFVRDLDLGRTTLVSVDPTGAGADNASNQATVSADGRMVAFSSDASNLVAGDTNLLDDIFVRDLDTNITTRVNVSQGGTQTSGGGSSWPSLTSDGRFVAFHSDDETLVTGDSNGFGDVFSHDCQTGRTVRLSVPVAGGQGSGSSTNPAVSGDGRFVAFDSAASNLVVDDTNGFNDVFVAVGPAAVGDVVRIIPGAASASGVGDAHFVTDVRLYNPSTESSITVFLSVLERNVDNSRADEVAMDISPRQGLALNDILATTFGLTEATGAIRMRSNAEFYATSRTYNVGGDAGTFGSFIPSLAETDALTQGILLQVANNPADSGFRSNVGFTNPGLAEVTITVKLFNADTGELLGTRGLVLPPRSFSQKNIFQFVGQKDLFVMNASVEFRADFPVLAYTTVIDNASDDPTCVLPFADQGTPP